MKAGGGVAPGAWLKGSLMVRVFSRRANPTPSPAPPASGPSCGALGLPAAWDCLPEHFQGLPHRKWQDRLADRNRPEGTGSGQVPKVCRGAEVFGLWKEGRGHLGGQAWASRTPPEAVRPSQLEGASRWFWEAERRPLLPRRLFQKPLSFQGLFLTRESDSKQIQRAARCCQTLREGSRKTGAPDPASGSSPPG